MRQVTGMFVEFVSVSSLESGEGSQSKGMFGLIYRWFVVDWRNFGSNCASAICIRNFSGKI